MDVFILNTLWHFSVFYFMFCLLRITAFDAKKPVGSEINHTMDCGVQEMIF